jgi:phosphoribosylformylglycinamidine (FGAM) synthase-like enzyme
MAIASELGAEISLEDVALPTATLFGERVGRVIVALAPERVPELRDVIAAAGVAGRPLGTAGGDRLSLRVADAGFAVLVSDLKRAWHEPF